MKKGLYEGIIFDNSRTRWISTRRVASDREEGFDGLLRALDEWRRREGTMKKIKVELTDTLQPGDVLYVKERLF